MKKLVSKKSTDSKILPLSDGDTVRVSKIGGVVCCELIPKEDLKPKKT